MIETKRKYYHSSSFKMAALFTFLLSLSAGILGYFIYAYKSGEYIDATRVAISVQTYELILWLGIISIFLMSVVVVISFYISTFVVGRINMIGLTAKEIMETGDLSRRIETDKRWDDLSNLAQILNNMFGRVEELMQDVRLVSDNIAHDLRTPLTRLKNNLEGLKKSSENKEDFDKLINEADELLSTFNALLRITNIEKGIRHDQFTAVELDKIINDAVELYEPIAEEKKITLSVNITTASLTGDRNLLFQAFANILDNAIKFTPEGGEVKISLTKREEGIIVEFSDTGIGIDKDEKEDVFERFYRADKSRNKPGSGLGLSLVQAVIKLHKGKIKLADNLPNGLIIRVIL